ncbi:hypothetical protein [Chitinophaga nivalis]|uniref:DUF4304 domain-containing protein n=1 Tax=Chitinophaga nivalis TaxID=2991709 RepID=A0ABT3IIT6_9BACT|nr:hypothetical protein [Chitinophaga nivalis]MCW3466432.1 hypothetical protein [Chitinophaga nivalis]MCW3483877.1 hypothetical protein [Chitinophaga nivalis]
MTQKQVIRDLLDLLQPKLNSFDFKADLKEQGFIRKEKQVTYYFDFNIYNRTVIQTKEKGFLIEPNAKISIGPIEKYYKEITVNNYLTSEWDFITLGNFIANLIANPDGINRKKNESLELLIFSEVDIESIGTALYNTFVNVAMPYYLENNTIERVDILLNSHPKEDSVHAINDLFRYIKGLIAAKLNNNPQRPQLLEIYNSQLVEWNMPEDCFQEMERFKKLSPTISI